MEKGIRGVLICKKSIEMDVLPRLKVSNGWDPALRSFLLLFQKSRSGSSILFYRQD